MIWPQTRVRIVFIIMSSYPNTTLSNDQKLELSVSCKPLVRSRLYLSYAPYGHFKLCMYILHVYYLIVMPGSGEDGGGVPGESHKPSETPSTNGIFIPL